MRYYAGVGSRNLPDRMAEQMQRVARHLSSLGYTLRSGGAKGADQAFESGASPSKEIFYASSATDISREFTKKFHPAPQALHGYVLDLMARNAYQVLGYTMNNPSDFLLCWTPDGCEEDATRSRTTGGTGQAISIASAYDVPVINLANDGWKDRLMKLI